MKTEQEIKIKKDEFQTILANNQDLQETTKSQIQMGIEVLRWVLQ